METASVVSRRALLTIGGVTILRVGTGSTESSAFSGNPVSAPRTADGQGDDLEYAPHSAPALHPRAHRARDAPEYHVNAGPRGIALTIDDGPSRTYTPQVLALLRKYGITASFCMIGQQIPGNRRLVAHVADEGHMICNHTWNHADQTRLSAQQVRAQIERTNEVLAGLRITPTVYRAPYGNWNSTILRACADADLRPVDWSVDPRDWSRPGTDAIIDNIMTHTRSGSIILEHDGGGDRSQTVAALKIVVPRLIDEGYTFHSL